MANVELVFNEVLPSKPTKRFILSKIKDWLKSHAFAGNRDEEIKIEFYGTPIEERVECHIEAKKGNLQWRNSFYGRGIQNSFQMCLKRLEKPIVERSA